MRHQTSKTCSKTFWITFSLTVATFVAINLYDYWHTTPACCDFSSRFGWPFALGRVGGFVGGTKIHLPGLLLDTLIAAAAAIVFALIVEKLSRLSAIVKVVRRT